MRSLIITVAGTSTRFNRNTAVDVLKCLYSIEGAGNTLLYQQISKVYDSIDEILIVGGYQYDTLVEFINDELGGFRPKIKVVYNDHYLDYGSGFSLLKGIEAVSRQADEIVFIEGDLFFDKESVLRIIDSQKDVISINDEAIRAEKAVAIYMDASGFPHYIYDTCHSCLQIDEPFLAIYNSGQMWKFLNAKKVRKICEELAPEQRQGTNLVIVQNYFGAINEKSLDVVPVKVWRNCNTVDDYMEVYNHYMK